jgi:hypothetical protein
VPPVLSIGTCGWNGAPSLAWPSSSPQGVDMGVGEDDVGVSSHGVLVEEIDVAVVLELWGIDQNGTGGGVGATVTVIVCVGEDSVAPTVIVLAIVVATVSVIDGAGDGAYVESELPSTLTIEKCGRS